jgi:serine/threonine-protein kinase
VIGLREPQAQIRIQDSGLEALSRSAQSDRPTGVVFAEKPGAGTQLGKGQTVTIFVSSGAKPVVVPRVVGQTQGAAVQALTALGLKPVLQNVPSDQPAGTVVGQKPPAGKEVDKGAEVTVNVSTGTGQSTTTTATTATTTTIGTTTTAAPVRVPRVVGLAQTPALRRLNVLGLRPSVVYVRSSEPANRVVSQSSKSGTSLRPGARIRVNVSTGPNPQPNAAVPNVVGQDQATAAQTLRDAGFKVAVLNRPTADQSKDGLVVEQQPRAASSIPAGSQVTIFIGRFSG